MIRFFFPLMIFFAGCSSFVNSYMFKPDTVNRLDPGFFPRNLSAVFFNTDDNEDIFALFYKQEEHCDTLLIFFHGNAGNVFHRIETGARLYITGKDVMLVEYRGYANCTGKPTEKGIYADGKAAIHYAIDSLGYKRENIFLIGRSLGTSVAIHNAQNENLGGVILISPFTQAKDIAKHLKKNFLSVLSGRKFNSIDKIENISSKCLFIHGSQDSLIPLKHCEALYEKCKAEKEMVVVENADHYNITTFNEDLFWESIFDFIK